MKHDDSSSLVRPGDIGRWRSLFGDMSGLVLVIQITHAAFPGLSTCLPLGSMQLISRSSSSLRRMQDEGDVEEC